MSDSEKSRMSVELKIVFVGMLLLIYALFPLPANNTVGSFGTGFLSLALIPTARKIKGSFIGLVRSPDVATIMAAVGLFGLFVIFPILFIRNN